MFTNRNDHGNTTALPYVRSGAVMRASILVCSAAAALIGNATTCWRAAAAPVAAEFQLSFDGRIPPQRFSGVVDFSTGELHGSAEVLPPSGPYELPREPRSITLSGTLDPRRLYELKASGEGRAVVPYIEGTEVKKPVVGYSFTLEGKLDHFMLSESNLNSQGNSWEGTATIVPDTAVGALHGRPGFKKGEVLKDKFRIKVVGQDIPIDPPPTGEDIEPIVIRLDLRDRTGPEEEKEDQPPQVDGPTLQSSRALDPFLEALPEDLHDAFRELAIRYRDAIPASPVARQTTDDNPWLRLFSPGAANNIFGGQEGEATRCGAYQGLVLDWLEGLQSSSNPKDRALVSGFDFGPIQIAGGAHQAVVLFPKGTDWKDTGIVLDPWKEQRPEMYLLRRKAKPIEKLYLETDYVEIWCEKFWLGLGCPPKGSVGNIFVPIDANVGLYPTTPNPDGTWRYRRDIKRSSPSTADRKHISVGSPVKVLLESADGKRLGITPDGKFVNDFGAAVEAEMLAAPDGTYQTSLNLPDGPYQLNLSGTGRGEVHVLTRSDASGLTEFQPVSVQAQETLVLEWREEAPVFYDQQGELVAVASGGHATLVTLLLAGLAVAAVVFLFVVSTMSFARG